MKMPPVLISAPSIPRRAEKRYRFSLQFSGRVLQFCKMGWHWSGSFVGADAHIGLAEHTIFTGIFGEFVTFIGPTESSAPTIPLRSP